MLAHESKDLKARPSHSVTNPNASRSVVPTHDSSLGRSFCGVSVQQLQGRLGNRAVAQMLRSAAPRQVFQRRDGEFSTSASVQDQSVRSKRANAANAGLPDGLKSGIEQLSGYSMDDVRVHYNSAKPAELNALAYAQGTDIHLAAGQEKHLPHEAWHVVQQMQGRVPPTILLKGGARVNDDNDLEREADRMGTLSLQQSSGFSALSHSAMSPMELNVNRAPAPARRATTAQCTIQRVQIDEAQVSPEVYRAYQKLPTVVKGILDQSPESFWTAFYQFPKEQQVMLLNRLPRMLQGLKSMAEEQYQIKAIEGGKVEGGLEMPPVEEMAQKFLQMNPDLMLNYLSLSMGGRARFHFPNAHGLMNSLVIGGQHGMGGFGQRLALMGGEDIHDDFGVRMVGQELAPLRERELMRNALDFEGSLIPVNPVEEMLIRRLPPARNKYEHNIVDALGLIAANLHNDPSTLETAFDLLDKYTHSWIREYYNVLVENKARMGNDILGWLRMVSLIMDTAEIYKKRLIDRNPVSEEPELKQMYNQAVLAENVTIYNNSLFKGPKRTVVVKYLFDGKIAEQKKDIQCYVIMKSGDALFIEYVSVYDMRSGAGNAEQRDSGWIRKSSIKEGEILGEPLIRERTDISYQDERLFELFPHQPCVEDIEQGGLGDCYLLAATASIVSRSPSTIVSMMRDNNDGTVTVRLYDIIVSGLTKNFARREVRIKKTIPKFKDTKKDVYARKSMWVQMLEKAYVAAGFGKGGKVHKKPTYADIAGGSSGVAMEHLLGREATTTDIVSISRNRTDRLPWSERELEIYNQVKASKNKQVDYQQLSSYEVFGHDIKKIDAWMAWMQDKNFAKRLTGIVQGKADITEYTGETRLENVMTALTPTWKTFPYHGDIMNWLIAKQMLPGKRGSGKYSVDQIELYETIRRALARKQYVAVGSKSVVGRVRSGAGRSSGEPLSKGLAGRHAYAVLACRPHGGCLQVELQNPWQSYSREYYSPKGRFSDSTKLHARTQEGSETGRFWLELSDLTKRFDSIYIG